MWRDELSGFSLAHLSDLHLPLPEARPPLRRLLSKRLFSYLSWRRKRRLVHRPEILAALVGDVHATVPDHLVVTGDLVNLALPGEFAAAADWLAATAPPQRLTVVPGNHDALVQTPWNEGLGTWSRWMGDVGAQSDFPFVRRLDDAALVGVSTATPTAPFFASGRAGRAQLERLERSLDELGREGLFRIVLLHHPITEGAVSSRKALRDRAALRDVLARAGTELVLHGHAHAASIAHVMGPAGPIPVLGVGSASAVPGAYDSPAGWRRIEVIPLNDAWKVAVADRHLGEDGAFHSTDAIEFVLPRGRPTA